MLIINPHLYLQIHLLLIKVPIIILIWIRLILLQTKLKIIPIRKITITWRLKHSCNNICKNKKPKNHNLLFIIPPIIITHPKSQFLIILINQLSLQPLILPIPHSNNITRNIPNIIETLHKIIEKNEQT
jgi:hypothetical protein